MDFFNFALSIFLWFGFTVFSTIYSKKYLTLTDDVHTLTLFTFIYPAILKLLLKKNNAYWLRNAQIKQTICLAIFNVSTILMTNIGMNETSVSLTYMVKVINFFSIIKKKCTDIKFIWI